MAHTYTPTKKRTYKKTGINTDFTAVVENLASMVRDTSNLPEMYAQFFRKKYVPYVRGKILPLFSYGRHWQTGETLGAWREEADISQTRVKAYMGFDLNAGGVPAMWIEYGTRNEFGTPLIEPEFNVYRAFKDAKSEINAAEWIQEWLKDGGFREPPRKAGAASLDRWL